MHNTSDRCVYLLLTFNLLHEGAMASDETFTEVITWHNYFILHRLKLIQNSSCSTKIWSSWCNTAQSVDNMMLAMLDPYIKLFFTTLHGSIMPYLHISQIYSVFASKPSDMSSKTSSFSSAGDLSHLFLIIC